MHNNTWKKERDLLEEAYSSVNETTHRDDKKDALGPGEYVCPKTGNIMSKDGKVVHKSESKPGVQEEGEQGVANAASEGMGLSNKELGIHADRPAADEEQPMPGELPDDVMIDHEPDEVDAEIDSLKNLILNPSKDKVEENARNGQLHVYVDMLKKKLEAAEAVKAAVRGDQE